MLCFVAKAQKSFVENGKLNGILPLEPDNTVSYQLTQSVDGTTKEQLFKRARKWFATTYNRANDVLQVNDPTSGELIGKGIFQITTPIARTRLNYSLNHTISVEVKNEAYRLTINGLFVDGQQPLHTYKLPFIGTTQNQYTQFYQSADTRLRQTASSLQQAMKQIDDF